MLSLPTLPDNAIVCAAVGLIALGLYLCWRFRSECEFSTGDCCEVCRGAHSAEEDCAVVLGEA